MRMPLRAAVKPVAAFCYVWLMVGFFTGTLVLLGPARWLTTALRARGYSQGTEDALMLAVMAAYVVASAAIAYAIFRWTSTCARRVRLAVPAVLTLAAGLCLWGWMSPARLAGAATIGGRVDTASGAEFVFGPYPDRATLERLKQQGYTGVISLQHPAVVPFEPAGIAAETTMTKEIGLEFIHAPMLPWVSSNEASLNRIRDVARTRQGRFYVHCGLGRDRVNLVKRVLELEGQRVATADGFMAPRTLRARVAENRPPFERGAIAEIDRDLWLVPFPNRHEFFANLLSGQARHVTLVLDPADPTQQGWIEEAGRILRQYSIPFDLRPLQAGDRRAAADIVQAVRATPRPEVVIVPFTAPRPSTEIAETLLGAFTDTHSPADSQ